jgi:hypothetical protein
MFDEAQWLNEFASSRAYNPTGEAKKAKLFTRNGLDDDSIGCFYCLVWSSVRRAKQSPWNPEFIMKQ